MSIKNFSNLVDPYNFIGKYRKAIRGANTRVKDTSKNGPFHNIDDSWIEKIEGKRHLVKRVEKKSNCSGCIYLFQQDRVHVACQHPSAWTGKDFPCKVIDLGEINKDGCLAEERTGKFPVIKTISNEVSEIWFVSYKGNGLCVVANGETKQEAINRWNRRVYSKDSQD
ncbi:MAG: hypothetical protein WC108_07590 [Bacteroidales bacterium]